MRKAVGKWKIILVVMVVLTRIQGGLPLNRSSFPAGFIFGAGSSAYQYEGAAYIAGKGESVWDVFTTVHPEKISDHSNGSAAEDFYHRYQEDIALMKQLGLDSFRFSISWSRVLPNGKVSKGVNRQGVDFYDRLINDLLFHGIQPFVTLLHYDPPQALQNDYGGFLSSKIVEDFADYADFCFKQFGDRVKNWVTINEPNIFSSSGYATCTGPPCRCSDYIDEKSKAGNSGTEPYVAVHHLLLSHATAVNLYRSNYQASQKGIIGISVQTAWMVPKYKTSACFKAAKRAMDFQFGWIVDPITFGDYPRTMRSIVGHRLPKFTKAQSKMLKGSYDFLGVNYYTAYYAEDAAYSSNVNFSYTTDSHVNLTTEKNGIPLGEPIPYPDYYSYPKGIQQLLSYIKRKYKHPLVLITENGLLELRKASLSLEDSSRISFHQQHLWYLLKAIEEDGVDAKAYYLWTFLDDFEWELGYTVEMGINYVDFNHGLRRYPKSSALWFKDFLQTKPHLLHHETMLADVSSS